MSGISSIKNEYLQREGFNDGVRNPIIDSKEFDFSKIQGQFPDKSIPLVKVDFVIYDAVVDLYGRGNFLSIKDALDSGAKNIYLKNGTHYINSTITITKNNINIVGESRSETIIKVPTSFSGNVFTLSAVSYFSISNLTLNGADKTTTFLYFTGCSYFNIQNCDMNSSKYDAITIMSSDYFNILNCRFFLSGRYDIWLTGADNGEGALDATTTGIIHSCSFYNTGDYSLKMDAVSKMRITANDFNSGVGSLSLSFYKVTITPTDYESKYNVVSANYFSKTFNEEYGDYNIVSNNFFYSTFTITGANTIIGDNISV